MEGAILSTPSNNNRFRTHLKNAASALCARTLPKQRRSEPAAIGGAARHHTYPRAAPPRRTAVVGRLQPFACGPGGTQPQHAACGPGGTQIQHAACGPAGPQPQHTACDSPQPIRYDVFVLDMAAPSEPNGTVNLKGTLAREVEYAWGCRVGAPGEPAPADRVQNLFNDIELYPTKTQVFEMLVCARQCARRKSLTLTFGEFCVFAAELRRCTGQPRQTPSKPESPVWNVDRDRDKDTLCKHVNGSEATPPPCEVFLGGSCNPTTWRSDIAIPMLKKMGITYFNPQVEDWSTELVEVEHRAKAAARALLFVLDSETRAVAASVEAAHLAAAPRDLLLVLRPYARHQRIAAETITDQEYVELSRARATLQEAVERRGLPAFTDIPAALRCARAVLRGARTHPRHSLGHTILRLKRTYDAAGGRNACLPRARAIDALKDVTRVQREVVDRCLPPNAESIDFETFCATVAELAADAEYQVRVGAEGEGGADAGAGARAADAPRSNGNARLRAYGRKLSLYIPKNGGSRAGAESEGGGGGGSGSSGDSVFTPGTERRLERLPAMLGAPTHDVYLGGTFPFNEPRPEEVLRREGLTYVVARANDYTRMFSAPARRTASAHPESPRHDKKPRSSPAPSPVATHPESPRHDKKHLPSPAVTHPESPRRDKKPRPSPSPSPASDDDVQLRDRAPLAEPADRLSASDFYTVTEDLTPQPFKGTYDEDLLLGSRVLVFSMSAEAPCFAAMVLAAHYMGLRPANTVLLVQPMASPAAAAHHQYSESAVKDYNRGRHYLADLARRAGVAVFDNVPDTVACVVARLKAAL